MLKKLKELAEDGVYFVGMIILVVATYIEEAYSWLRYERPAKHPWHDVD